MPRRLCVLPSELDGAAFSVGAATDAGATRQRLRHPSLFAPTRGLRVQEPSTTLVEQSCALALVLPTPWAYSHETAAGLLGLPLPTAWMPDRPLSVVRPSHCAPVRRPGVRGHRGLEKREVLMLRGLPVTDVVDTWCDLATRLGLVDLVVAGNADLACEPQRRGQPLSFTHARMCCATPTSSPFWLTTLMSLRERRLARSTSLMV